MSSFDEAKLICLDDIIIFYVFCRGLRYMCVQCARSSYHRHHHHHLKRECRRIHFMFLFPPFPPTSALLCWALNFTAHKICVVDCCPAFAACCYWCNLHAKQSTAHMHRHYAIKTSTSSIKRKTAFKCVFFMIMLFHLRSAHRSGHRDIGASNDINNITPTATQRIRFSSFLPFSPCAISIHIFEFLFSAQL